MWWSRIAGLVAVALLVASARSLGAAAPKPSAPKKTPPTPQELETAKAKIAQTIAKLKQQALAAQQQELARKNQAAAATLASLRAKLPPRPTPKLGPTVKLGQLPPDWRNLVARKPREFPADLPHVNRLDPAAGVVGKDLTLYGARFGPAEGHVNLQIVGMVVICPIAKWEDTKITITIPAGLEGIFGESAKDARLYVHPPTPGVGTVALQVGPDPARYRPTIIRVYEPAIVPGQLYVIEGVNFLHEKQGTVEYRPRALRTAFTCSIDSWDDTLLGVRLPADVHGLIAQSGVLTVTNHLGLSTTRPVMFQPIMDNEFIHESKIICGSDWGGPESAPAVFCDRTAYNTWTVQDTDSSPTIPSGSTELRWTVRPTRGSTSCRCVIAGLGYYTGHVSCYVYLSGPRGLPWDRRAPGF